MRYFHRLLVIIFLFFISNIIFGQSDSRDNTIFVNYKVDTTFAKKYVIREYDMPHNIPMYFQKEANAIFHEDKSQMNIIDSLVNNRSKLKLFFKSQPDIVLSVGKVSITNFDRKYSFDDLPYLFFETFGYKRLVVFLSNTNLSYEYIIYTLVNENTKSGSFLCNSNMDSNRFMFIPVRQDDVYPAVKINDKPGLNFSNLRGDVFTVQSNDYILQTVDGGIRLNELLSVDMDTFNIDGFLSSRKYKSSFLEFDEYRKGNNENYISTKKIYYEGDTSIAYLNVEKKDDIIYIRNEGDTNFDGDSSYIYITHGRETSRINYRNNVVNNKIESFYDIQGNIKKETQVYKDTKKDININYVSFDSLGNWTKSIRYIKTNGDEHIQILITHRQIKYYSNNKKNIIRENPNDNNITDLKSIYQPINIYFGKWMKVPNLNKVLSIKFEKDSMAFSYINKYVANLSYFKKLNIGLDKNLNPKLIAYGNIELVTGDLIWSPDTFKTKFMIIKNSIGKRLVIFDTERTGDIIVTSINYDTKNISISLEDFLEGTFIKEQSNADEHLNQTPPKFNKTHSNLNSLMLRGKVKSCIKRSYNIQDTYNEIYIPLHLKKILNIKFNENGLMINDSPDINDFINSKLKNNSSIQYDSLGRFKVKFKIDGISMPYDAYEVINEYPSIMKEIKNGNTSYEISGKLSNGILISSESKIFNNENIITTYKKKNYYFDKEHLVKIVQEELKPHNKITTAKIKYLKFDSKGNWLKRVLFIINNYNVIKDVIIELREIEYY